MIRAEIEKDLQIYINEHAKMQMYCYNLSTKCDQLGFPGFAHYFQVQAQDEVLHQRRIMNYIMDRDGVYELNEIGSFEKVEADNIIDLVKLYKHKRLYFAELTNKLAENAHQLKDLTTYHFYDWFIIDFYEELAEIKDLLDWLKISNNTYYEIDNHVNEREEQDTLLIIDPFSPHA